jgi:hypothetical protein
MVFVLLLVWPAKCICLGNYSRLVGSVNFDFVGVELTLVLVLGLGLVLPLFFAILTFNYKGFYLPTYFVKSFVNV